MTRLSSGGRLIDRDATARFNFDGTWLRGHPGDTLASALMANDRLTVGRSFKYHRPRGIVASGAEEPNALVNLGRGHKHEPNARATTTELFDGLHATSQNRWPSLAFDLGAINAAMARFLPAGFYYKTFIHPRPFWKHVYEPIIRRSAGLGRAPDPETRDPDTYEHFHYSTDLVVVGGGVAGLHAALTAAEAGARVLLVEQSAHWGGRAPVDGGMIDGLDPDAWVARTLERLRAMPNVAMRARLMAAGLYDHGYLLGYERLADHDPEAGGPRHRLWRIRARQVIAATGAIERPLPFAGNDRPGVLLASALRDYIVNYAAAPGESVVVVTNNDDAYRTALTAHDAGLAVPAVLDARPEGGGALMQAAKDRGIAVLTGTGVARIKGLGRVLSVVSCDQDGTGTPGREFHCDAVAMSGGWSPVVHLWSHCGGKLTWNAEVAAFEPDLSRPPTGRHGEAIVEPAGLARGSDGADAERAGTLASTLRNAARAAVAACGRLDLSAAEIVPDATDDAETPLAPVWMMPARAKDKLREKAWLDFQNDVKVSDVALAAREGYESVEHTKRYTTLGMATDQGKLSNINGLAVLADSLGASIPEVGTTTFRPPYTPISMGAIAGEAKGTLFQPVRRTPIHDWHEANGAVWEPVGQWRRPYCYPRAGETTHDAVAREILATRDSLGLLDASTLGKIVVKGPDAGRFLDMLYTNMMSTLKPGRCRYGLMCSENGFLMDDGVVARLGDDTFLCHTTTGGAERIHAHMEEWLQTEWWDWQVYTANVTEQYAQIAVVGPNARRVLEKLGGMDVSREALSFMGWAEGTLAGFPVRVFRISFSGELSYEIAVPAGQGRALWDAILEAGAEWNLTPYGTEALHVMRAEKGFIMIGDETDGTVIPQDLGLDWAISKKKDDYIGKRAQARSHMADPERWKLVGLETLDGAVLPDGAYAVAEGTNANGQRNTEGRVTSSYHSPTLGRGIAMGLVHRGPDRTGDVLRFMRDDGKTEMRARIVSPVFLDPEGVKQDA